MMRGPFFMSLGLHVLIAFAMVWASGAGDGRLSPLPSATVVKLIRPGMPFRAPQGNPPPGPIEQPPAKELEAKVEEETPTPPEPESKPPMTLPADKKPKRDEQLATNVPPKPDLPRGTGEKPTQRGGGGKELEGKAGTLRVSGGGFEYDFYLAVVQSKIEQNFRPPPGVRAQSLATVGFSIQKNGQISNITLVKPSGNLLIDQAAERAIRAAGRFPPLPPQYAQGQLDINFEFVINPLAQR